MTSLNARSYNKLRQIYYVTNVIQVSLPTDRKIGLQSLRNLHRLHWSCRAPVAEDQFLLNYQSILRIVCTKASYWIALARYAPIPNPLQPETYLEESIVSGGEKEWHIR